MKDKKKARRRALVLGTLGGVAGGLVAWYFIDKAIDKKFADAGRQLLTRGERELTSALEAELQRRIPPMVEQAMEQKLREYNITPETGARISRVLRAVDRIGII